MPFFLDNKGQLVVPSLQTLAMVSTKLTKRQLRVLPPLVRRDREYTRKRLGCATYSSLAGTPHTVPIYLAGDLTANEVPCHSRAVKLTRCAACKIRLNVHRIRSTGHCSNVQREYNSENLRTLVSSRLQQIKMIIVRGDGTSNSTVFRLRPANHGCLALEINPRLYSSVLHGIDLSSVDHLVMDFLTTTAGFWLLMENLTSLRILDMMYEPIELDFGAIILRRDTLRELRLTTQVRGIHINLARMLKNLPHLQLLLLRWVDVTDDQAGAIQLEDLELSSTLRSVIVLDLEDVKAENIIYFLTSEVEFRGEMVPRQMLLDDLTVMGVEREEMAAVYQSHQLTQRIKKRIYSDIDVGHLTSTIRLLSSRSNIYLLDSYSAYICKAGVELNYAVEPQPILLWVLINELKKLRAEAVREIGFPIFSDLLSFNDCTRLYGPSLLRAVFDMVMSNVGIWEVPANVLIHAANTQKLLLLFEERGLNPINKFTYLKCILKASFEPSHIEKLAPLFLKNVNTFSQLELSDFFNKHKDDLIRCYFRMITCQLDDDTKIVIQISKTEEFPCGLLKIVHLSLRYCTDKDLTIAAHAVLRRATNEPERGVWSRASSDADEQELLHCFFDIDSLVEEE